MSGASKRQLAKERLAYERATLRALRPLVRGTAWGKRDNFVFRELEDTFFVAGLSVSRHGDKVAWRLGAKPMAVDPVFWSIMGMEENREQPLSFRGNGAFVCSEVPIATAESLATSLPPDDMARAFLSWVDDSAGAFAGRSEQQTFSELVKSHESHRQHGAFAATLISALIAEGDQKEALRVATDFASGARSTSFVQASDGKSFFELAESWLHSRTAGERPRGSG